MTMKGLISSKNISIVLGALEDLCQLKMVSCVMYAS